MLDLQSGDQARRAGGRCLEWSATCLEVGREVAAGIRRKTGDLETWEKEMRPAVLEIFDGSIEPHHRPPFLGDSELRARFLLGITDRRDLHEVMWTVDEEQPPLLTIFFFRKGRRFFMCQLVNKSHRAWPDDLTIPI